MMVVLSRTHQKFSSNGLDLAELEPKQVDKRQISTGPVGDNSGRSTIPKAKNTTSHY